MKKILQKTAIALVFIVTILFTYSAIKSMQRTKELTNLVRGIN